MDGPHGDDEAALDLALPAGGRHPAHPHRCGRRARRAAAVPAGHPGVRDHGPHHADEGPYAAGGRELGGGVSACAVCDGFFYRNQDVVIVGAGDTAAEEATYLAKLCKQVYMLVRSDKMRASKAMQHRVTNTPNIEVLWSTETEDLIGDQGLEAVLVKNRVTGEQRTLKATGFFVAIGHKPNTDVFKPWINTDETGYILNVPGSSKTNIEGVFVAGDAADKTYRQAVTAAGTGCMAALDAERYLAAKGIH